MQKLTKADCCELLSEWLEPRDSLKCKLVIPKLYSCIASNLNFKSMVEYHPNMSIKCLERFSNIYIRFVSDELISYIQSGKVKKLKMMKGIRYRIEELLDLLNNHLEIEVDYNFISADYCDKVTRSINSIADISNASLAYNETIRMNLRKVKINRSLIDLFDFMLFPNLEEVVIFADIHINSNTRIDLSIFPKTLKSITSPYVLYDKQHIKKDIHQSLRILKSAFISSDKTMWGLFVNLRVIHTRWNFGLYYFFREIEMHCPFIEEIVIVAFISGKDITTNYITSVPHTLLRKLKVISLHIDDTEYLDEFLSNCTNNGQ